MDPTQRFSNRVQDYVRYRPTYPPEVIDLLRMECGLAEGSPVADVGSGTGILTALLLDAGAEVFAVEPNGPMREAAEAQFEGNPRFHSVAAPAESTELPDGSVSLVTCAQSFHWFANHEAVSEFRRILRPQGWLFLVWNQRRTDAGAFAEAYESILTRFVPDYANVRHRDQDDASVARLLGGEVRRATFAHRQELNREGLIGRVVSSSYVPAKGTEGHEELVARLKELFDRFAQDGVVPWDYHTECYFTQLS